MFYSLGVTSIYEYINLRFGKIARIFITVIFLIQSCLYNGLVVYAPALAMEKVAGLGLARNCEKIIKIHIKTEICFKICLILDLFKLQKIGRSHHKIRNYSKN